METWIKGTIRRLPNFGDVNREADFQLAERKIKRKKQTKQKNLKGCHPSSDSTATAARPSHTRTTVAA